MLNLAESMVVEKEKLKKSLSKVVCPSNEFVTAVKANEIRDPQKIKLVQEEFLKVINNYIVFLHKNFDGDGLEKEVGYIIDNLEKKDEFWISILEDICQKLNS